MAKPACYGFTNLARPGDTTESIYERCARDVLLQLGMYKDEYAIVFAHHPEFATYCPLHQMLMRYGYGKLIKSITIGYPIDMCPLQAADIVAYEIRCEERQEMRPRRYPLERLHQLGCISGSQARLNEAIMKMTSSLKNGSGLAMGQKIKPSLMPASKSAGSSEASTSRAI